MNGVNMTRLESYLLDGGFPAMQFSAVMGHQDVDRSRPVRLRDKPHSLGENAKSRDASAVDFGMGENAMVLGFQGGFRGVGDGGHLVFRQPALHRFRSGLGADRPREHLPPIV